MSRLFKATRKTPQELTATFTIGGITVITEGNDEVLIIRTSQDLNAAQRNALITRLEQEGFRLRFEA